MNTSVKKKGMSAPLKNLELLDTLAGIIMNRADHLPGLGTFTGPSGFGKSTAAANVAARHDALYLECRSTWSETALCKAFLGSMGIQPARSVYQMVDQISQELSASQRLVILDEFDNAVKKNLVELTRDIYEQSKTPIILIGEELLPQKLQKSERFHGRIMKWMRAEPTDLADARTLNSWYAEDILIKDDLLREIVSLARGSTRKIVTNIELVTFHAKAEGWKEIGKKEWGDQELHQAVPPQARTKF